jgi:Ulp1 family protease
MCVCIYTYIHTHTYKLKQVHIFTTFRYTKMERREEGGRREGRERGREGKS